MAAEVGQVPVAVVAVAPPAAQPPVPAQNPVRIKVKDVFIRLRGEVNQVIIDEIPRIKGPRCEKIEIANAVGLANDNVKNDLDYKGELDTLVDKVDPVIQARIKECEAMVVDLKEWNPLKIVNLISRDRKSVV